MTKENKISDETNSVNIEKILAKYGQKNLPSAFQWLSDKDLETLFSLGTIRDLVQGEVLIDEGGTDHQIVYVILDGCIQIIKKQNENEKEIATLNEGDWVGEIAFTRKIARTASAVAKTDSRVLIIDKKVISALDEKAQLFFIKRLNYLASARNRPSAFKGLSEKDLKTLYSLSIIKRLEQDEVLIRQGDSDNTVYVILNGMIRILGELQGQIKEIASLYEGDWLSGISFSNSSVIVNKAIAGEPTSVMIIDKYAINALEEKSQLFFYKRLNYLSTARNRQFEERERALSDRNKSLMEYLFSVKTEDKADYSHLEMIKGIISKIPPLSKPVSQLINASENSVSSVEFASLVDNEPALMENIVHTVNSDLFAFREEATDIHHAFLLLGLRGLYHLIISEGVRQTMPDTHNFQKLREYALSLSYIAYSIADVAGIGNPSQIAAMAILHNVGLEVIELVKERNPGLEVLIDSLNRAQMSALLLKEWRIPEYIWKSIEYQYYPEFCIPAKVPLDVLNNVAVLYIARFCYDFLWDTQTDRHTAFLDDYLALLGWEDQDIESIVKNHLVPALSEKLSAYPSYFQNKIKTYL